MPEESSTGHLQHKRQQLRVGQYPSGEAVLECGLLRNRDWCRFAGSDGVAPLAIADAVLDQHGEKTDQLRVRLAPNHTTNAGMRSGDALGNW